MYQFYYATENPKVNRPHWQKCVADVFEVTAIRPAMWEEHCLECSAPFCYKTCPHFAARIDGRCQRFFNSLAVYDHHQGCCGQGVHIHFRKWANMMTIIFPAMLSIEKYQVLTAKNQRFGGRLRMILTSCMPMWFRWNFVRAMEYSRRQRLRHLAGVENPPDAFIFHGWSHQSEPFRLIVEIFDDHIPVFKFSLSITPGENLHVIEKEKLSPACWEKNFLVKVYPENDLEAKLDILWCDFVRGHRKDKPIHAPKVKCVVWDLDNTLWNGVLIESENPETLQLRPGVLTLMQKLDERGILQSVASKNEYDCAMPILEKLNVARYFLYPQINWGAKSVSIRTIADELNIGIDTFALIDDSAFEREQVKTELPQVRVYTENEIDQLLTNNAFIVPVTDESRKRREMYQAEAHRNQIQTENQLDTIAFIKKCHLSLTVFIPLSEAEIERCFELVVRTNQLNMSGVKYTHDEFLQILQRSDRHNIAFACEDDYGEYGIVGFCQYQLTDAELVVTEFAMSCRVAGKFVESAFFTYLLAVAKREKGVFTVQKTAKNILLRKTLERIGFHRQSETSHQVQYVFDRALAKKNLVQVKIR